MGYRFRKRVKIAPGVHLNISKSGISFNLGVPGANVTLGKRSRLNVGLPGTGLSYQHGFSKSSTKRKPATSSRTNPPKPIEVKQWNNDNIISVSPDLVESGNLTFIRDLYKEVINNKLSLAIDLREAKEELRRKEKGLLWSKVFLFGFIPSVRASKEQDLSFIKDKIQEISEDQELNFLDLSFTATSDFEQDFILLSDAFETAAGCDMIWDINARFSIDQIASRSFASASVRRERTTLQLKNIPLTNSNYTALRIENKNGADIYFYPSFAVFYNSQNSQFAAVKYNDLEVTFSQISFCEEEKVPSDSQVVGHTWSKINKDGSRDKRFKDNYQIPIVKYGEIGIKERSGIEERFQFSSISASEALYNAIVNYQDRISCIDQ